MIVTKISSSITLLAIFKIPVNSTSYPVSSLISLIAPCISVSLQSKCPAGIFHFL